MENKCICCGADIPEGRMVCPKCEKTEQKKLTDEEILTAIEKCFAIPMKCEDGCPYFNKNGRNFCVENKAFYKDLKRIATEHAEQKDEIERLTEENAILKGNPPMIAGRSLGKTIREKLLVFDRMKEQNAELQKQVDELTEQRNKNYLKGEIIMKDEKTLLNEIKEQCGDCEAWSGTDCTRNPYTQGCLKDEKQVIECHGMLKGCDMVKQAVKNAVAETVQHFWEKFAGNCEMWISDEIERYAKEKSVEVE